MHEQYIATALVSEHEGVKVELEKVKSSLETLEKEKVNTLFGMSMDRLSSAKGAVQAGKDAMWSGIGDAFAPKKILS